jgi:hypothetical protein
MSDEPEFATRQTHVKVGTVKVFDLHQGLPSDHLRMEPRSITELRQINSSLAVWFICHTILVFGLQRGPRFARRCDVDFHHLFIWQASIALIGWTTLVRGVA